MPLFRVDAFTTPFGRNVYLRSTQDVKTTSHTCAALTVPAFTLDGFAGQKVLQPGTVMARCTSGADTGKVGPFRANGPVSEVQTIGLGAATAGTVTISFDGETTAAIAFDATAAQVQTALRLLSNINAGDVVVTGPDLPGVITLTFGGQYANTDVPAVTVTPTGLTGGTVAVVVVTEGASLVGTGATDGRGDVANIVGICNTFLPWQLIEGDREIAVVYEASVLQAFCIEYSAANVPAALSNATAAAMISQKALAFSFH